MALGPAETYQFQEFLAIFGPLSMQLRKWMWLPHDRALSHLFPLSVLSLPQGLLFLEHTISMCVPVHMWGMESNMTAHGEQVGMIPPRILGSLISKANMMGGIGAMSYKGRAQPYPLDSSHLLLSGPVLLS